MAATPGSAGPPRREGPPLQPAVALDRSCEALCEERGPEDERRASRVRLGIVEVNPVIGRRQMVFVVET